MDQYQSKSIKSRSPQLRLQFRLRVIETLEAELKRLRSEG
jgi:hypothetical protein